VGGALAGDVGGELGAGARGQEEPGAPGLPRGRLGVLKAPGGLACAIQSPGRAAARGQGSLVEAIWTPRRLVQPAGWLMAMSGSRHVKWMLAQCQQDRGYL